MTRNVRRLASVPERHTSVHAEQRVRNGRRGWKIASYLALVAGASVLPVVEAFEDENTTQTPRVVACGFAAVSTEHPYAPSQLGDAAISDAEKNGMAVRDRGNLTEDVMSALGRTVTYTGDRLLITVADNRYVDGSALAVDSDINSCQDFIAPQNAASLPVKVAG